MLPITTNNCCPARVTKEKGEKGVIEGTYTNHKKKNPYISIAILRGFLHCRIYLAASKQPQAKLQSNTAKKRTGVQHEKKDGFRRCLYMIDITAKHINRNRGRKTKIDIASGSLAQPP